MKKILGPSGRRFAWVWKYVKDYLSDITPNWLVRVWRFNRNVEFTRQYKAMEKALVHREKILMQIPQAARRHHVLHNNDKVIVTLRKYYDLYNDFLSRVEV